MFTLTFALGALTTCPASPTPNKATYVAHSIAANDLYSLRARKRMQTYLRLRLLELRAAELNRAAGVIEHRLTIDDLLSQEGLLGRRPPQERSCAQGVPQAG